MYGIVDRDQPVSRRSEPNSRTALIGEQPNPWQNIHHQDAMSRHRGAKRIYWYGLSKFISLLSLTYLLFVDRFVYLDNKSVQYNRQLITLKILVCTLIKLYKFILIYLQTYLLNKAIYNPSLLFRRTPPQPNYLPI